MTMEGTLVLSFVIAFFTIFHSSNCFNDDHSIGYEKLYELGMDAYKKGNWMDCTQFFQSAIEDYHYIKNAVIDCRMKCKNNEEETPENEFTLNFHTILKRSNCLRRCKKTILGQRAETDVSYAVDKKFEDRSPYNYAQFCYFKDEKYQEAAAAAYTYYITHQSDDVMIENIQYYKTMPGVEDKHFVDQERKPYQTQYINGLQAYNAGNWIKATSSFEEALKLYYVEEERCRTGCEKFYSHSGYPDFINAVADHYVTVLVCKQKCLQKLSTFGMENLDDFVAEHYNYLQYAYYEANNLEKAFESIANYLLFKPNDQEMLQNKYYYIKTLRHKETAFQPSKAVVEYVDMWRTLDQSLNFIREEYILPGDQISKDEEEDTETSEEIDPRKSSDPKKRVHIFEKLGINLVGEWGSELNNDRYITDGFIRSDQCEALADLARSKHSEDHGVKKMTVAEATELVKQKEDYEISLRLLLRGIEITKAYTSLYFNQSGFVVKDAHVNCRYADTGTELSDDCILQETGECRTDGTPQNEIMLVSFLTDLSDEGGQFFFFEENNIQPTIRPVCGRVVAFKSHYKHGIKLPLKQERCAIVITFSEDKELLLPDISEARTLLKKLEDDRISAYKNVDNTDILEQFYSQGVKIVQKGEDLMGKERFVSDGLTSEKECQELIELAKHGIQGNGYRGRMSPHTDHEIFTGLDVIRAEQRGVTEGDGYDDSSPLSSKFVSPYSKFEKFEGLNISRSLQLMRQEIVSPTTLQLFLDISELSRLLVEKYFNLTKPLYFDYTHLVCRTALEGNTDSREADLSHPVHSDNCMIQPDGSCIADTLAYAQRHYSAIMYLNDDFEGGEFFFAYGNKSEQISLVPKCGRLVAFNAGEYHGVKAVTKGQRCAIAMWYTHELDFVEVSRLHAQRALGEVDEDLKNEDDELKPVHNSLEDRDEL